MFKLEDCLAYFAKKEIKELASELDRRLGEMGLTRVQWMALYYIERYPEINQNQLANLMGSKQPTIAKLLDRMERDNLIERGQVDKRTNSLILTENGKELNSKAIPIAEKFKDEASYGIPEDKLDTFEYVLKTMVKNVTKK